jgi:hypothetical protein
MDNQFSLEARAAANKLSLKWNWSARIKKNATEPNARFALRTTTSLPHDLGCTEIARTPI